MIREKSCGAVVINDKNEVLLVKHNVGHISFPKGHIEKDEKDYETAYREVLEETGYKVLIDKNIYEISTYTLKDGRIKDVIFFKASLIGGRKKAQIEEVSDVMFVDINKAYDLITFDIDKKILKKIIGRGSNEN